MRNFKLNPLAIAMALAALPVGVYAQDSAPTSNDGNIEEVVVTGSFRDSLANAINVKRNSTSSVDSIIAEDIGKFPDNNLADSMQRIPGVNIDRVGGEGKQISVRGLSPDFSRVRVNGMETIATGYGNKSRAFDFNLFASELFSRIDVKKSQTADTEEGSLGATVDLFTARPLDSSNDVYKISYKQSYNDLSGSSDPRISALASFQNAEGTLGASFSIAYSQRNVTQEGHNSGRWEANGSGNNTWANAASLSSEVNGAVHPRFPRQLDREIDLDRLGTTATLQWKPTESTTATLDWLHSDFTYQQGDRTLTPISLSRTGSTGRKETTVVDYEYDAASNALVYAQLDGVDVRAENAFIDADTSFDQYSLNIKHDFTDSLRLNALLGSSDSDTKVNQESTVIFERFNAGFTYDYRGRGDNPLLSYDFDLTDPNSWQLSELRDRPADTKNTYDVGQLDLAWDISDIFTAKIGTSYKKFTFDNYGARRDRAVLSQSKPQGSAVDVPAGCPITLDDLAVTADMGSLYTPGNGQNTYLMPNIAKVGKQIGLFTDSTCFPLVETAGDDRGVEEKDTGYYTQMDWNTELGSMAFRGNLGVRHVTTKQSSRGQINGEDVTVAREYSDNLPSVNMVLEPVENVLVRASWSKVMTRPGLSDLTPGGTVDGFNRGYSAGNPRLDPFRAKAADISAEWYFTEGALVSLAYFKKDIDSFPNSSTVTVPWTSLGLPDSLLDNVPATPEDLFTYKSKSNGEGGTLKGWELQFETPFNFGPEWLHNFGIKTNLTKVESRVNIGTADAPVWTRLVGQSDNSRNATLWYENENGFQGRVSYTYRSNYLTSTSASKAGPGFDTTDGVGVVDASFSYRLNDNIQFSLEMLNMNNASETLLLSDYNLVDTTLKSGRQYYLGVNYTF